MDKLCECGKDVKPKLMNYTVLINGVVFNYKCQKCEGLTNKKRFTFAR
jgi:hypothetical protein